MGQSLSNVLVHLVFSTKSRSPWLHDSWREEFHKYVCSIVKDCNGQVIIVSSVDDHVHLFLPLPRTISISDLIKKIKSGSSNWIHRRDKALAKFQWQTGYGAFSVSPSHRAVVVDYIQNQKEHHKNNSF
jgi:REP element-mobilizing transposase RayT